MTFDDLQQLRPQNGERLIIVEKGKPLLVVLDFQDYKRLRSHNVEKININPRPVEEKAAFQIQGVRPQKERDLLQERREQNQAVKTTEKAQEVKELKEELKRELTLEDLPF